MRKLIIGLDTGVTVGVAILDLEGELVTIKSSKDFSRQTISKFILDFGDPVLIASDVRPAPKLLEKIAATFSARVIFPPHSLSRKEKTKLLKSYKTMPKIKHERDALAAALYALEKVKPLIERVDKKLAKFSTDSELKEKVRELVLSGEERNISLAIKHSLRKPEKIEIEKKEVRIKESEIVQSLKSRLEMKAREIEILKNGYANLKNKIRILESVIAKLREETDRRKDEIKKEMLVGQSRIVRDLKTRLKHSELVIKKLKNEVEKLETLARLETEGWKPVLVATDCGKQSMKKLDNKYGLSNKWVCILSDEKISGIKQLGKVNGVVCRGKLIELIKNIGKVVIDLDKVKLKYYKNFGVIKVEKDLIRKEKEQSFSLWLEKYKKRMF